MIRQGSPEWFAVRLGRVTASRIADVMARTKTGWGAGRANYMAQLLAERLTGTVAESYTNAAMQWGTDTEPLAADAYAFRKGHALTEVGFVIHDTIEMAGASPDRLVGADGLVEIKCPNTATHIDHLLGCAVPKKYILQMQWQMACTGRAWCDFVSFDPRLPEEMRLSIKHFERDNTMIEEIEGCVMEFLGELADKEHMLRAQFMA